MNSLFPREISVFEKAFIALGLILAAGAPFPLLRFMQGKSFEAETGDPLVQLVWVAVYAIVALPLLLMLPRALWLWRQNLLLVLLVFLAVVSSIWSLESFITPFYSRAGYLPVCQLFSAAPLTLADGQAHGAGFGLCCA
jgi:hypothetical protein